jgi:chemotaxis protein CheZ
MSHNDLHATIARELAAIKSDKGSIPIEDVSAVLEKIITAISPGTSSNEVFLRDEITRIAAQIQVTKNEILALSPGTESTNNIGEAAVQLDAVVKATEEAAHTIMDAADEIQTVVAPMAIDEKIKQTITDITARIYEACNFQDLTGQRIKKVMQALDITESRIRKLIGLFSSDGSINPQELAKFQPDDDSLLNGPQLPGHAPSQAEIDAMFGKLSN